MLYFKTKTLLVFLAIGINLIAISLLPSWMSQSALGRGRISALDNDARARLRAAVREMRRHGIRPRINSAFRSRAEQRTLYRCARIRRCRARRGIYGARRPGTSMHEAGLAVDLGGVATGRRHRRLTPRGRLMVRIMRRHGFRWRYGLGDPAHFELSPRLAGYHTERAAIRAGQRRWLARRKAGHRRWLARNRASRRLSRRA
jgi:LAS superfamily LD-carboxypeptidase LdcB